MSVHSSTNTNSIRVCAKLTSVSKDYSECILIEDTLYTIKLILKIIQPLFKIFFSYCHVIQKGASAANNNCSCLRVLNKVRLNHVAIVKYMQLY